MRFFTIIILTGILFNAYAQEPFLEIHLVMADCEHCEAEASGESPQGEWEVLQNIGPLICDKDPIPDFHFYDPAVVYKKYLITITDRIENIQMQMEININPCLNSKIEISDVPLIKGVFEIPLERNGCEFLVEPDYDWKPIVMVE